MDDTQHRPLDDLLKRILPDADNEARERAREVLRAYALALLRRGEKAFSEAAEATDSPEVAGRPIL